MLGRKEALATIPVRDVQAAKKFYEGTLGFKLADPRASDPPVYQSGNTKILVYESQYAGTNKATAVTWPVGDDLEKIVQEFKNKGITFEHYDLPGTTRKGDIHVAGNMRNAWFKDPDGNILALVSE